MIDDTTNTIFIISNILFIIGAVPMLRGVIMNRSTLRGYSTIGASMTTLGMIGLVVAYAYSGSFVNTLLQIPSLAFWGMAAYYSRKQI